MSDKATVLEQRRAGVLLHPTSLPGNQHIGDIGGEARNFLHFMADSGLSVWQMLPLGPTHLDGSPYQCPSAFAGNPEMIDLQWLVQQQWLQPAELDAPITAQRHHDLLQLASERFFAVADVHWFSRFEHFKQHAAHWLNDFSLYMALKHAHDDSAWLDWPAPYKFRLPEALTAAGRQYAQQINTIQFSQFVFYTQWHELRDYAKSLDIKLFGDMPIYVSMDSADAWAHKEVFLMHEDGHCDFVAGVPPDAFSETGQLWGNPLYDWKALKQQEFSWWIERFKTQLELFDLVRIDHFRGLESCWHIPALAETAIDGKWVKTPGHALLKALHKHFDPIPLVAEDLGVITEPVRELRDKFELPGMAVLQFAFDGCNDNLYLPHNVRQNQVIYTGTHDNDTSLGWYQELPDHAIQHLCDYLGQATSAPLDMPWILNRMALSSVANLAILPMQDLLGLDSNHRMNTPGSTEDNWQWRFDWSMLWPSLAQDLRGMIDLYQRLPG